MKTEIKDPWLGQRTIDSKPSALISDQLRLLMKFRDDGRVPSQHLLDDIKVYEFILKSDDPDVYANMYLAGADELRKISNSLSIKKMDVAKKLGWKIL